MRQNVIYELRKLLDMDQNQFAEMVREKLPNEKTSKVQISRWENGYHYPSLPIIKLIAEEMAMTEKEVYQNLTNHLRTTKIDYINKRDFGKSKYSNYLNKRIKEPGQTTMF